MLTCTPIHSGALEGARVLVRTHTHSTYASLQQDWADMGRRRQAEDPSQASLAVRLGSCMGRFLSHPGVQSDGGTLLEEISNSKNIAQTFVLTKHSRLRYSGWKGSCHPPALSSFDLLLSRRMCRLLAQPRAGAAPATARSPALWGLTARPCWSFWGA